MYLSYQLLLTVAFLHHLYHTSHLLLLYILFQDAQLPILMACCAANVFCYVLIVCSSLQAKQENWILLQESVDASDLWQHMIAFGGELYFVLQNNGFKL